MNKWFVSWEAGLLSCYGDHFWPTTNYFVPIGD